MDKQTTKTPAAPAPDGADALQTADALFREGTRLAGLMKLAERIKAVGSLEAAATAAEMRHKIAVDNLNSTNATISERQKEHDGIRAQTEKHASEVEARLNRSIADAEAKVAKAEKDAKDTIASAKAQAELITGTAKAEGEAYVAKVQKDTETAVAGQKEQQRKLDLLNAEIERRQKALNEINATLAKVAGGLNNEAANSAPS